MFEINKEYTRDYIQNSCGGSKDAFLPTLNGKVVAACLRADLNPHAPEVIICSDAPAARAAGKTLARQAEAIPVFIKLETELFRYVGQYAVSESLTVPVDCGPYAQKSGLAVTQVSRVIKMNRC
jgi:hypothetical protein